MKGARRPRAELLALALIAALAAALRIGWVAYAARTPVDFHDPFFYFLYGQQISEGNGYRLLNGEPTAYYPAGYSAALGLVFWLVRHTPLPDDLPVAAGLFNAMLGTASVVLTHLIARRLFDVRVGLIAAGLVAVFPNLIFHTGAILSETLFIFLALSALAVVVLAPWEEGPPSGRRLAAFGLVLGASALVRPVSLLFLPVLAIVLRTRGAGGRLIVRRLVPAVVATALVIAPWSVRNFVVMDAPVIISTNLGDDLCIGRNPQATGGFNFSPHCGFTGYRDVPRPRFETVRNDDNIRKALTYLYENPWRELKLIRRRAMFLIAHDHDGLEAVESYGDDRFIRDDLRPVLRGAADYFFWITLGLGVIALPAFFVGREPRRLMVVLTLIAIGTIPLAFFGDARFHVPAVPLLAMAAAVTLAALVPRRRGLSDPGPLDARGPSPDGASEGRRREPAEALESAGTQPARRGG